ncbi:hypothetical protein IMZ11_26205 [Microtetraspora sp. AC03309]|uniref:hypothetical protein n=1 Tax=Microtetraspora sp. AC03309 TaxID=2779376 RepID=UPI001E5E17E2|nr:hypothetical protein [Microtetraspora sp. AC03309]MCC5579124.1 hypothetical protein [Microtetraspora sp. AC03309]
MALGQLAKWCFGLENAGDAKFGLSEAQRDAGARPQLWANKQPGMSYLDAPSIPDERIAMPNRTWDWGEDDQEANARMRRHAEAWPANAKEVDEFTAIIYANYGPDALAGDGQDDESEGSAVSEYVRTEDPSPEIEAGPDDPIEAADDAKFPERTGLKMEPGEARGVLLGHLQAWVREGRNEFATRDLCIVRQRTGLSRAWIIAQLNMLAEDGVIERDDARRSYRIIRADVLTPEPAGV